MRRSQVADLQRVGAGQGPGPPACAKDTSDAIASSGRTLSVCLPCASERSSANLGRKRRQIMMFVARQLFIR